MVCFTAHGYTFTNKNRHNWAALLAKFLSGVECTVTVDGGDPVATTCGRLHTLPEGEEFYLETKRFWAARAATHAMPTPDDWFAREGHTRPDATTPTGAQTQETVATITGLIASRRGCGSQDIMLRCGLAEPTFDGLLLAASLAALSQEDVTRFYCSRAAEQILLVLADRHCIAISTAEVSDWNLPALDFEDGFKTDQLANHPPEWDTSFAQWRAECLATDYASWQNRIL